MPKLGARDQLATAYRNWPPLWLRIGRPPFRPKDLAELKAFYRSVLPDDDFQSHSDRDWRMLLEQHRQRYAAWEARIFETFGIEADDRDRWRKLAMQMSYWALDPDPGRNSGRRKRGAPPKLADPAAINARHQLRDLIDSMRAAGLSELQACRHLASERGRTKLPAYYTNGSKPPTAATLKAHVRLARREMMQAGQRN